MYRCCLGSGGLLELCGEDAGGGAEGGEAVGPAGEVAGVDLG